MLKVIGSILAFIFGSSSILSKGFDFKAIKADIFDEFSLRLRKPVALILLGLCSIFFFCGGSFMAILDATSQFDRTGQITHTSTLWTGIGIALFFLTSYLYVFIRAWPRAKKSAAKTEARLKQEQASFNQQRWGSDIEHAIAMLIQDFIENRKYRRNERRQQEAAKDFYQSRKEPPHDSAPH